jgi:hypothetical protein
MSGHTKARESEMSHRVKDLILEDQSWDPSENGLALA